jgi:RNA-directed DNA polymerase
MSASLWNLQYRELEDRIINTSATGSFPRQRQQTQVRRRIAPKALTRFMERIRDLTQRTRGISVDQMIGTLKRYLTGWCGYFGFCETPSVLKRLDEWIRRRIRCFFWKQWKRGRSRFKELTARGVSRDLAAQTVGSPHNAWRLSCIPALGIALPNRYLRSRGLPSVGPVD